MKSPYNAPTMFTGLIQAIGRVSSVQKTGDGLRLSIEAPFSSELEVGESVAVNGACLTVITHDESTFTADVMPESLGLTTLDLLGAGDNVNLERALKVGDRLGGHFVQGHVDSTGGVRDAVDDDSGRRLRIGLPSSLSKFVILKGSITINGVSLTVSAVSDDDFEVALVPHTLSETTLDELKPGDTVNLEVDLLARYLAQLL